MLLALLKHFPTLNLISLFNWILESCLHGYFHGPIKLNIKKKTEKISAVHKTRYML